MATTVTNDIARMLEVDLSDVFTDNYNSYPLEWPSFCTERKANKLTMKYDSMGNIDVAQIKTESDTIQYRKITQAYQTSVTMKTVVNGISFSMESKKYDQYSVLVDAQGPELARTMREFEENRVIRHYDNVTSAAYALSDGQAWATNSRPCKNSASTNDTYATTSSLNTPENHKTMIKMFADFKNHAGGKMKSYPTDGVSHRYNMAQLEENYQSDKKAQEFSNTKNVLPGISWHYSTYISSTTYWGMYDKRYPNLLFVRFSGVEPNSYEDVKDTLDFFYNVNEIFDTVVLPNIGIVHNTGA